MRVHFKEVLQDLDLLNRLKEFEPVLVGSPALEVDTESSDIDVACYAENLRDFAEAANRDFGQLPQYSLQEITRLMEPALVVSFSHMDWEIELFCQSIKTEKQWGVRQFRVEERLLALAPALREQIVRLKQAGYKTEPAFAQILQLEGDPYEEMMMLESKTDSELQELVDQSSNGQ